MEPLSYPVILAGSAVVLVLLSIIVGLTAGSWTATIVVLGIAAAIVYVLTNFGSVSLSPSESGMNIDVDPIPNPHDSDKSKGIDIKEVFHISQNSYTYDEAPAVCAAYGASSYVYEF